jgi:hypothetical protein
LEEDSQKFHIPPGERDYLVPLRNGSRMDIREVSALMGDFRSLRKNHPQHWQALLAVAQGQATVDPKCVEDLKEWKFLAQDGRSLRKNERDVLLSAGPELENPCLTDSVQDKLTVALAEEQREDDYRNRVISDLLRAREGGGRSPG